ncbi:MAG TPA: response regulator transcription factor [Anaerolineae bacterium]|nr:response regulator transcription factor [Anaerolineae bacterium]HMR66625.1 response regulator transcription factor [Anaerolineae bacterium]
MIRVILADDHHLVRQGIRSLLEKVSDVEIIAEAENGQEALNLTRNLTPDVLVIDINMPRLNGIQAAEQIRSLGLASQIVILSMYSDETLVRQALQSGVRGYILKRSVMEELLLAVRAAYRGELFLSPSVSEFVLNDFVANRARSSGLSAFEQLSSREREILKLIAEGHTNKSIAETMHLSAKTVEKHRASLMTKLEVDNLANLIRVAIKHGLIFLDE